MCIFGSLGPGEILHLASSPRISQCGKSFPFCFKNFLVSFYHIFVHFTSVLTLNTLGHPILVSIKLKTGRKKALSITLCTRENRGTKKSCRNLDDGQRHNQVGFCNL